MIIPSWNWKKVCVQNLEQIQKEFAPLIEFYLNGGNTYNKVVNSHDKHEITNLSESYCDLLKKLDLFERLSHILVIAFDPKKQDFAIHVDTLEKTNIFSFNIPLLNCENTYTAWYDTIERPSLSYESLHVNNTTVLYKDDECVEINRMDATNCAFVCVAKPHRGISGHNNLRLLLSSRFNPELDDEYFQNRSFC